MTKRAIIYVRVSTEEQGKGYSLQTQIEKCREFASKAGYIIVAEFQDMHTGTELDRPGLSELYQYVERNGADALIVYDIDRLSREVGAQAVIEMEMARLGVEIKYVLGSYDSSPEGELMKLIKAGIAQYENRQRVERMRRGKLGKARAGYVVCAGPGAPFGYTYVSAPHKGWLVINEQEAEVVRKIYQWLTEDGLSSYAISRKLWEEHILTRGDYTEAVQKKGMRGAWSPSTIRRIASNPVYKGVWYYGKTRRQRVGGRMRQVPTPESEWIPVAVPAIVDTKTWEWAQTRLAENRQRAKRNRKRDYLLQGMVFCPCGRRWIGRYKNHLKRGYYRCPSNEAERWRRGCNNRFSIRQEVLETAVWERICALLLDPENLRSEIERRRAESEAEAVRKKERLVAIDAAIAEVDRKMSVLLNQVLMDGFVQSLIDGRKQALAEERAGLESERARIQEELQATTITSEQEMEIIELACTVGRILDGLEFKDKRRVLELLELRVNVITRTQIELSGVIGEGLVVNLSSA